jgi:hypothetical protein
MSRKTMRSAWKAGSNSASEPASSPILTADKNQSSKLFPLSGCHSRGMGHTTILDLTTYRIAPENLALLRNKGTTAGLAHSYVELKVFRSKICSIWPLTQEGMCNIRPFSHLPTLSPTYPFERYKATLRSLAPHNPTYRKATKDLPRGSSEEAVSLCNWATSFLV